MKQAVSKSKDKPECIAFNDSRYAAAAAAGRWAQDAMFGSH